MRCEDLRLGLYVWMSYEPELECKYYYAYEQCNVKCGKYEMRSWWSLWYKCISMQAGGIVIVNTAVRACPIEK